MTTVATKGIIVVGSALLPNVSGQTLASNSHVVKGSSAKHRECCAVDDDASVATTASGEKSEAALGRANPFFD